MRVRVVFSVVCIFTMLIVALFVELDIPSALSSTPLLKDQLTARDKDSRQWILQDKTIIPSSDSTGALHVRRKMLRKLSASRMTELKLDAQSLPEELSLVPAELLQGNVKVPADVKLGKVVTVVLGNGQVEPRLVHTKHSDHLNEFARADSSPPHSQNVQLPEEDETQSQLRDIRTDENYSDLTEENTDNLLQNQPMDYLIGLSQSIDIDARSKWQMQRVNEYCSKHGLDPQTNTLPKPETAARHNLLKHILFDDKRQLIFCFLPKVGCTNTRRFFFVLSGAIPLETIYWKVVPENEHLHLGIQQSSLLNPTLNDTQRLQKMTSYWKFVILRNPLERLVSAFRNKLEAPLDFSGIYSSTFEMHKRHIMEQYAPNQLLAWTNVNGTYNLTVDFQMYIRWVIDTPNVKLNEHFIPMIHLSQPCRLRYHFYGNFKRLSSEMNLVMERYQIPTEYFYDHSKYLPGQDTSGVVQQYYSTVSPNLKYALLKDFHQEMEFYYLLFPEDDGTEYEMLGLQHPDNTESNTP